MLLGSKDPPENPPTKMDHDGVGSGGGSPTLLAVAAKLQKCTTAPGC